MSSSDHAELTDAIGIISFNEPKLRNLLARGINVNIQNINGRTPLYYACELGRLKACQILLEAGADPNLKGINNDSPLIMAAKRKDSFYLVILLLNNGADPNLTGVNGTTALIEACAKDQYYSAEMLISRGAQVNVADNNQKTPFLIACEKSNLRLIKLLLDNGADINFGTPLLYACKLGIFDVIQLLVESGASVNQVDHNGSTALMRIADSLYYPDKKLASDKIIPYLLKHGASINAVNKLNRTALVSACYKTNVRAAIALISAGADITVRDKYGYDALYYARQNNLSEIVKLLEGDELLEVNLLIKAVIARDETRVKELIANGANVNSFDKKGNTPLILACKNKLHDIAKILIEAKADVNLTPKRQNSPLELAFRFKMYDLALLFIKAGADVKQNPNFLLIACQRKNEDLIIALVNAGAPYNQKIKLSRQSQRMQFFLNSRYFGINVYVEQVINILREDTLKLLTPQQREIRQILLQGFQQPESDFSTLAPELLNLIFIQCLQ